MINETIKILEGVGEYNEINSRDKIRSLLVLDKDGNIIIRKDNFNGVCKTGKDNKIKAGTVEEIAQYIEDEKLIYEKIEVIDK